MGRMPKDQRYNFIDEKISEDERARIEPVFHAIQAAFGSSNDSHAIAAALVHSLAMVIANCCKDGSEASFLLKFTTEARRLIPTYKAQAQ